jgi:hypothetical protein
MKHFGIGSIRSVGTSVRRRTYHSKFSPTHLVRPPPAAYLPKMPPQPRKKAKRGRTEAELATTLAASLKIGLEADFADALVVRLGGARIAELLAVLADENAIRKPVLTKAYMAIAASDNTTDLQKVSSMLSAGLDDEYAAVLAAELLTEPQPNTLRAALRSLH